VRQGRGGVSRRAHAKEGEGGGSARVRSRHTEDGVGRPGGVWRLLGRPAVDPAWQHA
jgi:hypothetical protein